MAASPGLVTRQSDRVNGDCAAYEAATVRIILVFMSSAAAAEMGAARCAAAGSAACKTIDLRVIRSRNWFNIAGFRDVSCEPGCVPATRLLSPLLVLIYLRLFVQHGVEHRTLNLDFPVVVDESLFPDLVLE